MGLYAEYRRVSKAYLEGEEPVLRIQSCWTEPFRGYGDWIEDSRLARRGWEADSCPVRLSVAACRAAGCRERDRP